MYNEKCFKNSIKYYIIFLRQVQLIDNKLVVYFVYFEKFPFGFSLKITIIINIYLKKRRLDKVKQINREVIINGNNGNNQTDSGIISLNTDENFSKEIKELSENGEIGIQIKKVDFNDIESVQKIDIYLI